AAATRTEPGDVALQVVRAQGDRRLAGHRDGERVGRWVADDLHRLAVLGHADRLQRDLLAAGDVVDLPGDVGQGDVVDGLQVILHRGLDETAAIVVQHAHLV